jgi:hypothetical protein
MIYTAVFALCCCVCAAALPYLQPQVEGFPMPAVCRASQLILAVLEALLAVWLLRQTWRAWAWTALRLGSSLGLVGLPQQVCGTWQAGGWGVAAVVQLAGVVTWHEC